MHKAIIPQRGSAMVAAAGSRTGFMKGVRYFSLKRRYCARKDEAVRQALFARRNKKGSRSCLFAENKGD
jgi:hypothetical protein